MGLPRCRFHLPSLDRARARGSCFGAVSDRYGPKRVSLLGFVIASVSLALLAFVRDDSDVAKAGLIMLLFTLSSLLGNFCPCWRDGD